MTLSSSFSNKRLWALLSVLFCLAGCAGRSGAPGAGDGGAGRLSVAVLPIENLTGSAGAPVRQLRRALLERLQDGGSAVMDEDALGRFMARHRVRYVGGVDAATARAFREEAGVQAVLVTNLVLYNASGIPKIGLYCRLVSTGDLPEILWMAGIGMAGDDHPGLLDLGLVPNPDKLADLALDSLMESLFERLAGIGAPPRDSGKFAPKVVFNPRLLNKDQRYSIGVVPFNDLSGRPHAGEILALHLVSELVTRHDFKVMEPGVLRAKLLELRIIMQQGISLQDLYVVHKKMQTDLLMTGKVVKYEDPITSKAVPSVEFTTLLMEGEAKKVIWASTSYNSGAEGVFFFDVGRTSTAFEMAARMTRAIAIQADTRSATPSQSIPGDTDIFRSLLGIRR